MTSLVINGNNLTSNGSKIVIENNTLGQATEVLRAVNHPLRQRLIQFLNATENVTVTELYVKLRLEQSLASQHLAILRKAGIVATARNGKYVRYSLNRARLRQITDYVKKIAEF